MTLASVELWGKRIAAVSWQNDLQLGLFEYDPNFLAAPLSPSPIHLPLHAGTFAFQDLARGTYQGLPGMLADVLPDRFGNAMINAWLASQGRTPESFNPVERLCYTGTRGMGALEFKPLLAPQQHSGDTLQVAALVELANSILADRSALATHLQDNKSTQAVHDILRVGTSAGGARAKAVIAWNPQTGECRSGQSNLADGFEHWLMKFDGVTENRDRELNDPLGYGLIEYAYSLMAKAAGITMSDCRIMSENGRHHFLTKRFDRTRDAKKLHMQSLCAMGHLDFRQAGAHSYEQAMLVMRQLGLSQDELQEQFRRMVFNVVARNQDDHTKNIAYLMDKTGKWSLSPAFDITWAYNPIGDWTSRHQMSLNGKCDDFAYADFVAVAQAASIPVRVVPRIVEQVRDAVSRWGEFASKAGVSQKDTARISDTHRLGVQLIR